MVSKFLSRLVMVGLTLGALAGGASAQSTDPSRPTPWTGFGYNGRGNGTDVTYYFSVNSPPGNLRVNLALGPNEHPGTVELTLMDSAGTPIGRESVTAWAASDTRSRDIAIPRRQTMLMAVHVNGNVRSDYSYWLEVPRAQPVHIPTAEEHINPSAIAAASTGTFNPPPAATPDSTTWSERGNGTGATHELIYPVTIHPGDFELSATCQARVWSTSVTIDLIDDAGIVVCRAGAIATREPATGRTRYHATERRNLRVRITVDANCDTYQWALTGPAEH